jgi:two-component system cell cycle sensor histidine kinase/response regulator CckA
MGVSMSDAARGDDMSGSAPSDVTVPRFFDLVDFGVTIHAPDGRIMQANDYFCELVGLSREHLLGVSHASEEWKKLKLFREDGTTVAARDNPIHEVVRTGRPVRDVIVGVDRPGDGGRHWLQLSAYPSTEVGAKVTGVMVTLFDVTERKRTEQTTREGDELFLKAFHTSPACQMITSAADGEIHEVNQAFCDMSGYAREELLANTCGTLQLCPELETRIPEVAQPDHQGRLTDREIRLRTKSGEYRDVISHVEPLEWRGVPSVIAAMLDVTELKKTQAERSALQEQLFQAQKMEMVGQLAGGIAHDFNNILMVQRGYCELMRLSLKEDDPLTKGLGQIESYIEKAAALTSQLLAFSRKQPLRLEVFDFNYMLEDLEPTLRRVAGEHVELITRLSDNPATVEADRSQMQQVLVNLIANARQMLPEGGKVSLNVSREDLGTALEGGDGGVAPGRYVMVSVSDTGPGMDAEAVQRIFEPFFRGAERRRDPGLGLSAVYGVVRQSGGNILVRSEPGAGTTFQIYMPRVEARVTALPKVQKAAKGAGQMVLVVEDEPTLRELVVAMIKQLGYQVAEAGNGSQALALVEREHVAPDLVLTDVIMPEMGGTTLVQRLRSAMPDLRVIYMSGYADATADELEFGDPRTAFLRKPFSLAALESQIKELLGPTVYH